MKRVAILGSTGSIGTQTLDVIAQFPDRLKVIGLAARSNEKLLTEQTERFQVKRTALYAPPSGSQIKGGMDAIIEIATADDVDIVVVCVAGVIGLQPTIEAIKAKKNIALASKEVLVAAGEIVMPLVRENGVTMTPIDSEHSALFQCLQGYRADQIDSLILTASGGPFRGKKRTELEGVTVEDALNHPTWRMGGKITIDSATLMNKGLETIEAKWLFGVDIARVDVVVHPQSVMHSMVKFRDGSVLGQLGWPDMRLPIAYALLFPERLPNQLKPWEPAATPNLTFEPVDEETFDSLELARAASRVGGTMPAAMNAANEEAANAFLRNEIRFLAISDIVRKTMRAHNASPATLDNIVAADSSAREEARRLIAL